MVYCKVEWGLFCIHFFRTLTSKGFIVFYCPQTPRVICGFCFWQKGSPGMPGRHLCHHDIWSLVRQAKPTYKPCYTVQFSQQLVLQWHCKTSCWRIAQCNMGCLAMFLLREALHEVELSSAFRIGLQQLTIPLHSVSPLQQLVSQFYGSFNKNLCAHFLFFVARNIARQVAEKISQCNKASTPNLGNLQRYISNHCETSC